MNTMSRKIPAQTADPRLYIPWSEAASRDRLSSTLFLAGLFHGIILLGVTFTSDDMPPDQSATSFDVVLVTNQDTDLPLPNETELLAQQNMIGAGNTSEPMQLKTALNQTQNADTLGPDQTGNEREQQLLPSEIEERPTIVARSISSQVAIPDLQEREEYNAELRASSFMGETQAIEIVNEPEQETLISDTDERELIISANTREARIAAYLSQWKNSIERVGTLNYPNLGDTAGLTRFPTLEVAIDADGQLRDVIILTSSGIRSLDQAAMNIVNMSAPFEPFPEFLRTEYDVLRFAYEWRFTDGMVSTRSRGN